ncbi:MAG: misacylated tRNA(Ala) deacylase [Natrialbaceae archaeon]|jgi:misacylated tRNA(Ala) deacylase
MTEERFLEDSNEREFEATIERVVDDRVVLDATAFYPEGGGQPADRGWLRTEDGREWRVSDVQKQDTIYHHLDGEPPVEGTTVVGELDWNRRYAHMRYHTAQHLLSAVVLEEFDAMTSGNQLYHDRARIDFEYDRFTDADLDAIGAQVNDLIEAALPVRWDEMDRERAEVELDTDRTRIDLLPDSITQLRIVEIGPEDDTYDRVACAGTHVENTERCGEFSIVDRKTKGADEERLTFELA